MFVGISPQSLSSLTVKFGLSDDLFTFRKLRSAFASLGMKCFDLSLFNALSLHLSYLEFASRSKVKSQKGFY